MDDTDSIKSEHGVSNPCACIVGCSPWKISFKTCFCRKVELNLDLDLICIYLISLAVTYVCFGISFFLYIMSLYYILIKYFSGYTVGEEAGQLMGGSASPSTCELEKMLQRALKVKAPSAHRHTQLP